MSLVSSPFFFSSASTGFYPYEPTGSLRFEEGDSPKLTSTPTSTGNRRTFTYSAWVKRGNIGGYQYIITANRGDTTSDGLYFHTDNRFGISFGDAAQGSLITTALFRDTASWYHIVWEVDTTQATAADRVKLYINGTQITAFDTETYPSQNYDTAFNTSAKEVALSGYFSSGSLYYFDGYMSEIYFIDGTAHDADAFGQLKNGVWMPKDASGSLTFGTNGFYLPFNSTVTAEGQSTVLYEGTGAIRSVQGFGYKPDFLWVKNRVDTADHRLFDRVRGPSSQLESSDTTGEVLRSQMVYSFNSDGFSVGTSNSMNGSNDGMVAWAWDAGADQTPTGFGCVAFTGSGGRRPVRDVGFTPDLLWFKQRDGTSSHALFDSVRGADKGLVSSSTAAQTTSNSGNDLVSFESDGATTGTPQHYGSLGGSGSDIVAWAWDAGDGDPASNDDGDITSTVKASDTHGFSIGTFTKGSGNQTVGHGLSAAPDWLIVKRYTGGTGSWAVYHSANTANPETEYLRLNSTDGTADNDTFWNDTAPTSSVFTVGSAFNSGEELLFYAWTEKSGYSKFTSYSGNGSATGPSVTLGFRPAFLMVKRTDVGAEDWNVFDTTRQPSNGHFGTRLFPNTDAAETNVGDELIEITSTGFQLKTTAGSLNADGGTYIVMAFAGGIDTIAPVNTDGDIDSRVKASDDTGFSILRYQGTGANATIGHGLSSAPELIIVKNIDDGTKGWPVYPTALGNNYLELNNTNASFSGSTYFNNTAPTSSVFSVGTAGSTNASGDDFVAYCFHSVSGYSKIGSYTGTGASGNSVTGLGFEPGFVMIKNTTDSGSEWMMFDSQRDPDLDDVDSYLKANSSAAETTDNANVLLSFDSDGFTVDGTGNDTNGDGDTFIYMAFKDGKDSSFFHDESGQGNSFEPENVQNYDVVPDSPVNTFCTINPLATYQTDANLSEGSLSYNKTSATGWRGAMSTFAVSSGKWYWEATHTGLDSNSYAVHGVVDVDSVAYSNVVGEKYIGQHGGLSWYLNNGDVYVNGSVTQTIGNGSTNFDVIGYALDMDAGTFDVYRNGVYLGELGTGLTGTQTPAFSIYTGSSSVIVNFGQDDSFAGKVTPGGYTDENERGSFKYPVPSGFLSLCTANLPEPDISPANGQEPADYFNTVLYTGTGAELAVTGVGFQPDWVWTKERNAADPHRLYDVVRGATKAVESNSNNAEITNAQSLKTFDSDGFTLGTSYPNNNGDTYAAWNWLAGGTAVSNTDGDVTSSVSANTKAGFSVVGWSGASAGDTIGHGLNSAPEVIFAKSRDNAGGNWHSYHSALTADYGIVLNLTNAKTDDSGFWNDTEPTSSVFTVGTYGATSGDHIAYCFHSVEGYSKVGSYTGNGSSDGPYVPCGFRPSFFMWKRTDSATGWGMIDAKRDIDNVAGQQLFPHSNSAEASYTVLDFLSNGIKMRNSFSDTNASGGTYIFIAFAESPFKYAQAR